MYVYKDAWKKETIRKNVSYLGRWVSISNSNSKHQRTPPETDQSRSGQVTYVPVPGGMCARIIQSIVKFIESVKA